MPKNLTKSGPQNVAKAPNKWIILDRDGVINHDSDAYIKSPEEWLPIDGSIEAIARLNQAGYEVLVITNQSGLARHYFDQPTLGAIHAKMAALVSDADGNIHSIYFCPHGPDDECDCRKPKAGLFLQAAAEHNIDLARCYAVGDSIRDLEAAHAAGALPLLVETGKGRKSLAAIAKLADNHWLKTIPSYSNLAACVDSLLKIKPASQAR